MVTTAAEQALGGFFDNPAPRPLSHDRGVGDQIFDALKLAILRMDITPGALISETEVAGIFDASRTPVREAMAQLRAAGLVVTSMGRGNFATKLSTPRIAEARFIREVIELGVVDALCDGGLDDTAHAALARNLDDQLGCVTTGDKLRFWAFDDQFHALLAGATGYPRMAEILEREKMLLDRLRVLSLDQAEHMQQLHSEHSAIFRALTAQNRQDARHHMRNHLTSVLTTLNTLQSRHQEYFE